MSCTAPGDCCTFSCRCGCGECCWEEGVLHQLQAICSACVDSVPSIRSEGPQRLQLCQPQPYLKCRLAPLMLLELLCLLLRPEGGMYPPGGMLLGWKGYMLGGTCRRQGQHKSSLV